jgi:hypothetical protein
MDLLTNPAERTAPDPGKGPTESPMDRGWVIFLSAYLLITALLSLYSVYALWAAERPTASVVPAPPPCGAAASVTDILPKSVPVGFPADVVISGCGFVSGTLVAFNGAPHPALYIGPNHMRVTLTAADVAAPVNMLVTLTNPAAPPAPATAIGTVSFIVVPAKVSWSLFFFGPWNINLEVQLLLMVLLTGAFGSCIYAMKSLADYRGDNKLFASWVLYYWIQPFEGAGIAFLLYLVIRGGFLGGTTADVKTANQFGMCAIAGLAGAFSDTAFLKLREVFQTLFKPQDDRSGKLAPKITTTTLPDGVVGTPYKQTLQATGGTAPLKWSVNPPLPAGLTLDAGTGSITGTPTAVTPKATYKFTVTDSAPAPQSTPIEIAFEIKAAGSTSAPPPPPTGLKITTTSLPAGTARTAYSQTLKASGGTAPLRWSVAPPVLPAGLALDAGTGAITGTPAATSASQDFTFSVTDSATPPLSDSKKITLSIQ